MGFNRIGRQAAPGLILSVFLGLMGACTLGTASGTSTNYSVHIASWKFFTSGDISGGAVGDMSLDTGAGGAAFIVYQDWGPSKATARQLIGNAWTLLGSAGFSDGGISTPSAAYDSMGMPYVVYKDAVNGNAATLMQFNGSDWVSVGGPGFTPDTATDTSLAIDSANTPYVAYSDGGTAPPGGASVMKFSAGSWVPVGAQGFSGFLGGVSSTSIAIDSSGTPYVAYEDGNTGNNATVMMFNGSVWVPVGTRGFASSSVAYTSLAINPVTQDPWVAFYDTSASGRATVMAYHAGTWAVVGSPGFSAGSVTGVSLKFDSKGNPFVACSDGGLSSRAVVYQFNGPSWKRVGNGVSAGAAGKIALSMDFRDTPVCAYRDDSGSAHAFVASFH